MTEPEISTYPPDIKTNLWHTTRHRLITSSEGGEQINKSLRDVLRMLFYSVSQIHINTRENPLVPGGNIFSSLRLKEKKKKLWSENVSRRKRRSVSRTDCYCSPFTATWSQTVAATRTPEKSHFQRRVRHQRIISSSPSFPIIPSHHQLCSFTPLSHHSPSLYGDINLISHLSNSTATHLHR